MCKVFLIEQIFPNKGQVSFNSSPSSVDLVVFLTSALSFSHCFHQDFITSQLAAVPSLHAPCIFLPAFIGKQKTAFFPSLEIPQQHDLLLQNQLCSANQQSWFLYSIPTQISNFSSSFLLLLFSCLPPTLVISNSSATPDDLQFLTCLDFSCGIFLISKTLCPLLQYLSTFFQMLLLPLLPSPSWTTGHLSHVLWPLINEIFTHT